MVASILGPDSWSSLELDEVEDSITSGSETFTLSSESSNEFVVDENYMIIAQAEAFDEMSDIVDSVASNRSSGSRLLEAKQRRRSRCSTASLRRLQLQLAAISEEEESDPCEAYLRAKMTALWTRIQESAQKADLSATPSTKQDEELLRAYENKNDTLLLLRQQQREKGWSFW